MLVRAIKKRVESPEKTLYNQKMNIGERIRQLRKERDWTQDELAQRVGILSQNVARYENGRTAPRKRMLEQFAMAFEMTPEQLLSDPRTLDPLQADDPELARLFREIVSMSESDRDAVKRVLTLVVRQSRIQQMMAS